MINPNELRVGNWLETYGLISSGYESKIMSNGYTQVAVLDLQIISDHPDSHTYRAIPLTPEILIACGFRKGEKWFVHQVYYRGFFDVCCTRGKEFVYGKKTEHGFDKIVNLKYLHQLQNLFFALYGEEIKYIQ